MDEAKGAQVLVIDANAHIRRLIATVLRSISIARVIEARTPDLAIPSAREADLIFADWGADPTQVLLFVHRLRRGEFGDRTTPVIAMAAPTFHAAPERAWQAGIDDMIGKPLSVRAILDRTTALLAGRHRVPPLAIAEAAE